MLHSLTQALLELQTAGISHGDIQPVNVMIDETGNIKLLDAMCYDSQKGNGLMRIVQNNIDKSPLAPELMLLYLKKQPQSPYSTEKADIFSLGITILSICSVLDYRTGFYNFDSYDVSLDRINQELTRISQSSQYSAALVQVLSGMLNPNPQRRFTLCQLNKFILDNVEL